MLKKILLKYFVIYISIIFIIIIALTCVCALPNKTIKNNLYDSAKKIYSEGEYRCILKNNKSTCNDGTSDSMIFNINHCIDPNKPFESMLKIPMYKDCDTPVNILAIAIDDDKLPNAEYSRYWHGYLIFLRPLLFFFNYSQIRLIFNLIFYLLIAHVIYLLNKKINLRASICFIFTAIACYFLVIPFCINYFFDYLIMLSSLIYLLKQNKPDISHASSTLFIIGSLTSAIDLLTNPIITLNFFITILFLLIYKNNLLDNFSKQIYLFFKLCISWSIGYALTWISKWLICDMIYHDHLTRRAFYQIIYRTHANLCKHLPKFNSIHSVLYNNFSNLITPIILTLVIFLILIISGYYHAKISCKLDQFIILILCALLPIAWLIFTKNHACGHAFFTYRNLSGTIFCVLLTGIIFI